MHEVYRKAGHEFEFKDVDGLEHLLRKSEAPYMIEWLNSRGVVKNYSALLASAQEYEKKKQFPQAMEIYKKLTQDKRAHPASTVALERLEVTQQAQNGA